MILLFYYELKVDVDFIFLNVHNYVKYYLLVHDDDEGTIMYIVSSYKQL